MAEAGSQSDVEANGGDSYSSLTAPLLINQPRLARQQECLQPLLSPLSSLGTASYALDMGGRGRKTSPADIPQSYRSSNEFENLNDDDPGLESEGSSPPDPILGGGGAGRAELGLTGHLTYGLINSIVQIPVMLSFCKIIFSDVFFLAYADQLAKLVMFSAAVHSACFSAFSQMPFAVGQVQDAGLIFMSMMATTLVSSLVDDVPAEEVLATVLCTLALSTLLLGLALIATGRLKLGSLVQYLPLPVIGGYLAFIGLFCGQAGLGLMARASIKSPLDLLKLDHKELVLLTPGLLIGILIYALVVRVRHFSVLPVTMGMILVGFYLVLLFSGTSVDEARELGWMPKPAPEVKFWTVWSLYNPEHVHWEKLLHCVPTWIGMYFVVAFGSSLDVAAIQMDMGKPLDINKELQVVGASNAVSGLLGGYAGSYIFSQTIFNMRAGVTSRITTGFGTVMEVAFFLSPVSPLPFIPNMFFGAILVFIMLDLGIDWLWHARKKLALMEYLTLWISFLLIIKFGLEVGMVMGCVVCALTFVLQYARTITFQFVEGRARVVRSRYHAVILRHALAQQALTCLQLNGYIFFGSSLQITKQVGEALEKFKQRKANAPADQADQFLRPDLYCNWEQHVVLDFTRVIGLDATAARAFAEVKHLVVEQSAVLVYAGMRRAVEQLLEAHGAFKSASVKTFAAINDALVWSEDIHLQGYEKRKLPLAVVGEQTPSIVSILQFCLTAEHHDLLPGLSMHSSPCSTPPTPQTADTWGGRAVPSFDSTLRRKLKESKHEMGEYFVKQDLEQGVLLFQKGDKADAVWLVAEGHVTLQNTTAVGTNSGDGKSQQQASGSSNAMKRVVSDSFITRMVGKRVCNDEFPALSEDRESERVVLQCGIGAAVGDMDFVLQQRRSFSARVTSEKATVYMLTRAALDAMTASAPSLASVVHSGLLKSTYLTTAQYLEAYV